MDENGAVLGIRSTVGVLEPTRVCRSTCPGAFTVTIAGKLETVCEKLPMTAWDTVSVKVPVTVTVIGGG